MPAGAGWFFSGWKDVERSPVSFSVFLVWKTPVLPDQGPTLRTSFNHSYFLKHCVSKQRHTGWGVITSKVQIGWDDPLLLYSHPHKPGTWKLSSLPCCIRAKSVPSAPCSPVPIACLSLIQAAATVQQYRGRGKRVNCFLVCPGFVWLLVFGCPWMPWCSLPWTTTFYWYWACLAQWLVHRRHSADLHACVQLWTELVHVTH